MTQQFPPTRDALPAPLLQSLADRLALHAARADLLDVRYDTLETPVGSLLIALTQVGVVRIGFESEGHSQVLCDLENRVSHRIMTDRSTTPMLEVKHQLDAYFAGTLRTFSVRVDLSPLTTAFRRSVLEMLPRIGYGSTGSYTEMARLAGCPTAVRAVASALATNPVPIVLPCHRVVRSDGSVGGYLGGVEAKHWLLQRERNENSSDQRDPS